MSDYAQLQKALRTEANRSSDKSRTEYNKLLQLARALTRVTGADTTLLTSNGASLTKAVYQVDLAAGGAMVAGLYDTVGALDDQDLIADLGAIGLDGVLAEAISLNEYDVEAALVLVIENTNVITLRTIFGAEAPVGTAVPPTAAQCALALKLYGDADYLPSPLGMVIARITIRRSNDIQVVTWTFTNNPVIDNVMSITVNDIVTDYTAVSAVLNDEVGALRSALVTALAAEAVTVSGATNVIIVTADVTGVEFTYDSLITLTGGGTMEVAEVLTTDFAAVTMVHAAAASDDALKQERLAGVLA